MRKLIVLAVFMGGCGGASGLPVFNASTEAAVKSSVDRLTPGLSDEDRKKFRADVIVAVLEGKLPMGRGDVDFSKLNGMTAEQIREKAAEIRAAKQKP